MIDKFTKQPIYKQIVNKINEIIDNLGSSVGANTDLSNLSSTGEAKFQAPLVSGTNIKTINSTSLLGSGNIDTSEIFVATYGTTTYQEIDDAYQAGKTCFVYYPILNGTGGFFPLTSLYSGGRYYFSGTNSLEVFYFSCDAYHNPQWAVATKTVSDNTLSNVSSIDSNSAVQTALNGKANTSISNLTDTGKVTISHLTCPSFNKYKTITLGASGTSYEAPADGWFSYVGSASSAGRVDFSSSVAMYDSRYTMPGEWCGANIRVAKGQRVTFYYNGTFNIGSFRFIYDIGTESEYA